MSMQIDPQFLQSDEVRQAYEGLTKSMESFASTRPELQTQEGEAPFEPKSWFSDPYAVLDSMGLGYRNNNSYLTYETLKMAAKKSTLVAAIIRTRTNQVNSFCQPQLNRFSTGYKLQYKHKPEHHLLTAGERDRVHNLQGFLENTGKTRNKNRDKFKVFIRKIVQDRLVYDQAGFELVRDGAGRIHEFFAVPGETLRIATPKNKKNAPLQVEETDTYLKYVQVINGQIMAQYTQDDLAFLVANPRTDLYVNGYGHPELELLITQITSHLWAEEWNRRAFSQGSTTKGLINIQGNIAVDKFAALKRQWLMQLSGINNAWKTPMINSPNQVQFLPLQMNNVEMGYGQWMEYLIKMTTAIYQIDPSEVNFDLRGGMSQQPMFMSNNQAQQEISKDKGLPPLLEFIEEGVQTNIVDELDPDLEFKFVGLKAKTEEQNIALRQQQVSTIYTLNEARAMEDLKPLPKGDIPLNAAYTGHLSMEKQSEQQGAQGGAGGGQQPEGQPPGDDDPEEAQPSPFEGQFSGKGHGKEEERGADNLRQAVHGKPKDDNSSPDDPEEAEDGHNQLHHNDWSNTMRHSLAGDRDLIKGFYDTIEVE